VSDQDDALVSLAEIMAACEDARHLCLDPLVFPAGEAFTDDVVQMCELPRGHAGSHASSDGWQWT